jgi:succinate-semialdehyde dehydrogenase/glutarate-semialdehyde dehydrogenase
MMLINGKWIGLTEAKPGTGVMNPATEEIFEHIPQADSIDIKMAVDAASGAFTTWSSLSYAQRGEYLKKAAAIANERRFEIGRLMTMEMGKPHAEAVGEVEKAAKALLYYAEEGQRVYGRIISDQSRSFQSHVAYYPVGPVAAIIPWNYPIELLAWKACAALTAGCTMVIKPASITPLSSSAFCKCLTDAGLPDGVINLVFGSGSVIGKHLISDKRIKKVAFTGSTEVGKKIVQQCAVNMTKYSAELGGHCPMIVGKSADIDAAASDAARRSFRNMGQICIAINRIYVQSSIYDSFIEKLKAKTEELIIGDSLTTEGVNLGPMADKSGLIKIKDQIKDAISKGAACITGGTAPEGFSKGYFFKPTILTNVNHDMLVMKEESFGPIVGVMPFDTTEEAVELANDTNYGLAAYVQSNDYYETEYFIENLSAGNVAVNNPDAGVMNAPYGGWNDSGDGYEHGPEGLYGYLKIKQIRKRIRTS